MTVFRNSLLVVSLACAALASQAMAQASGSSFDREHGTTPSATPVTTPTTPTMGTPTGEVTPPADPSVHFVGIKAMNPSGKDAAWMSAPVIPDPVPTDGTTTDASGAVITTGTGTVPAAVASGASTVLTTITPATPAATGGTASSGAAAPAATSSFDRERGVSSTTTPARTTPRLQMAPAPRVESSVR